MFSLESETDVCDDDILVADVDVGLTVSELIVEEGDGS